MNPRSMRIMFPFTASHILLLITCLFFKCNTEKKKGNDFKEHSNKLKFETLLMLNEANQWFAMALAYLNGDGAMDVLTGINKSRAANIGVHVWPVVIAFNEAGNNWRVETIDRKGIYNGHVGDFEGNLDIFRLISHDDNIYQSLINQLK